MEVVIVVPTLSVAGAYSTGDYIGQSVTPEAFPLAANKLGGEAIIKSLVISDKTTTAAVALELWLFSQTFVAPTDNAAWAVTDAEALTCVGVIPITTDRWFASSNNKIYSDDSFGLMVECAGTSLFYALVARGTTPSWTAGDLQISLGLLGG
jgi:hypothetical protein